MKKYFILLVVICLAGIGNIFIDYRQTSDIRQVLAIQHDGGGAVMDDWPFDDDTPPPVDDPPPTPDDDTLPPPPAPDDDTLPPPPDDGDSSTTGLYDPNNLGSASPEVQQLYADALAYSLAGLTQLPDGSEVTQVGDTIIVTRPNGDVLVFEGGGGGPDDAGGDGDSGGGGGGCGTIYCGSCSASCGGGTQTCLDSCGQFTNTCNTQSCCVASNPNAPTLSSPTDDQTLGNVAVTLSWSAPSAWGTGCPANTNTYLVYADTSVSPTTLACTVADGSTSCDVSLIDETTYFWKVVSHNGTDTAASAIWSFSIRQPKINSSLYEDSDQNGCYNSSSGEGSVGSPNNIVVSANGQQSYCIKNSDTTYRCSIPGSNTSGQSTVINISSSGYNPPYTAQTNCSTGTNASCSVNNCSLSVSPGEDIAVNIGYAVKPWFQVNSCSVYSGGDVVSLIPANAQNYDTGAAVLRHFILNQAGSVLSGSASPMDFGNGTASLSNWLDINYQTVSTYNYDYFVKKLANKVTKIGSGGAVTLSAGQLSDGAASYNVTNNSAWDISGTLTVSDDTNLDNLTAVFLVSGNININSDFSPANGYFAFISNANLNILQNVAEIHGVFFANNQISDGAGTSGLKIVGNMIALNGLNLQRQAPTTGFKPAEYFVCDPALFINLTDLLGTSYYRWEEAAP